MKLLVTIPILLLGLGSAMSAKKGSEAGKLTMYTFYGLQEIELQERVLKFWKK